MKNDKFVSAILILAMITIMISIAPPLFESIDATTDMTNSTYENQYNATTDIVRVSLSVFSFVPLLFAVGVLIMAVKMKK